MRVVGLARGTLGGGKWQESSLRSCSSCWGINNLTFDPPPQLVSDTELASQLSVGQAALGLAPSPSLLICLSGLFSLFISLSHTQTCTDIYTQKTLTIVLYTYTPVRPTLQS